MLSFYSTPERVRRACHIALRHNLCAGYGAAMIDWYNHTLQDDPTHIKAIVLYKSGDTYTGALVILKEQDHRYDCNCGIWVNPSYRRLGIGRKLITRANERNMQLQPWRGRWVAQKFYDSVLKD
jgi:GNAT superfamily N-acetyltransferase